MHRHWTYKDWLDAYDGPDDERSSGIQHDCAEADALWPDLGPWIAHATTCDRCRNASAEMQLVPDEVLNCPDCLEAAEFLWAILRDLEHFEPAVARELPRAEAFMDELAPLAFDDQLTRVRAEHRYQQWGFCQWLLFKAEDSWHTDPHLARDRADLAVTIAELLDAEYYHPQWLSDLQAKAHAYLANAHRILADFSEAERHFLLAEQRLRHGVGCTAEARVLSLKASLLIDQYRYSEALALIDRVSRHYEAEGNHHQIARLAMKRAKVLGAVGKFREAADEELRAARLLDSSTEPHLFAFCLQNAATFLINADEPERARHLFGQLPPVHDSRSSSRRRWIEGHLLRAECRYSEALAAYSATRETWAEMGLHYDAALVTMDMALAAYAAGDDQKVVACAEEASVLLVRAAAKHEAFAVLTLLFKAIERQTVSRAVLESIRERLATLQPS